MIDDATLAEIDRIVGAGAYPCAYCPTLLEEIRRLREEVEAQRTSRDKYHQDWLYAKAEIRRLREERNYALGKETDAKNELANRDYVEWRRAYDSDLGKRIEILSQNLSAHQAVVRELAKAAEHFRYCDLAGSELEHRCERCEAADILVVAARKEGA